MTGYTINAYLALLIAAGFGASFFVGLKIIGTDTSISEKRQDARKALVMGFVGVIMLLQIALGGF